MAITSDKLELVLPDRGEFPGEWDIPLNTNLEKIDLFLWKAYTHNPSDIQPAASEMTGSPWYKVAEKLLMLKGIDGNYHAVARHKHTDLSADGDFSKVDLTDGNEVRGTLPSYMVAYSGLNAERLGGKLAGEYVSLGGTGIEVYTDPGSGQGAARIRPVAGFTNSQEFNRVFVDISGRIIAGELKNTLSGLGITDAVTRLYADATYATQVTVNSNQTALTTAMQTWVAENYAAKAGNAAQNFSVQTNSANAADAVSVSWASTFLASKAGNSLVKFNVATADIATYNAVPRNQADTLYAAAGHNHSATYVDTAGDTMTGALTVPTLTSTGIVNADGGINIPTGRVIAIADAPIAGTSAVNMNYITANYATISGVSGAYAPKAGDLSQTFAVSEPASSTHAIPKSYADSNYANLSAISDAINSHGNSGDHDERYVLAGNTAKATVLNTGFFKTRIDANGQPDVFSVNGNSVDLFASEESPTTIFVPAGIDINGIKSEVMSTIEPVTDCFSVTPLLPSTTHYAYVQTIGVTDITITGDINSQLYDWALTDETVDFKWESTALFWEITWTALGEITGVAIYNNVLKEILLCSGTRSGNVLLSTITLAEEGGSGLSGSVTIQAGYPIADGDTDNSVIIGSIHSKIVSGSFGYSLLEPIYSIEEPASPVLNQIWFSINDYIHMEYDGAGWLPVGLVFLATITTDAASTPAITALSKSKIAYDMRVAMPTLDDQAANKKYVDTTANAILTGPQFKITPEGGYATKMVNLSGNATVKGAIVRLVPGEIIESGDTANQLSGWQFFGPSSSNTNLGTVYWDLIWTLTGQITTINIYKDLAKTQLVASGTRSGNTTAGEITLTASNASGLTGLVSITGGANPIQDNDDANTLFIGVDNAVSLVPSLGTMPVGVFYESGIANGSEAWVVISGNADVLISDTTTNSPVVRGGVLIMSATAGQADWYSTSVGLTTDETYREIGHNLHGVSAGINRLVRASLR